MNHGRELLLTRLMLAFTAFATVMAFVEIGAIGVDFARAGNGYGVATQLLFAIVVAALTYGFFVYLLTRLGQLQRRRDHKPTDRETLETIFLSDTAPMAVLVPSYKEESAIVRRTLLSAALQEYPRRRVVLLIDDPHQPRDQADAANLEAMRRLPRALRKLFDPPAQRFAQAEKDFVDRCAQGAADPRYEAGELARLNDEAAAWFKREIRRYRVNDQGDALFVADVLTRLRDVHRDRAQRFARLAQAEGVDPAAALREYRRLAVLFRVEFASFERKRYENLSHEVNKAMNLNSYLALMGKSFEELRDPGGTGFVLHEVPRGRGTLDVPDAELVLTLDADSVLVPDYALRLAHFMNEPGNERVAVVQTPYSAFPGAPRVLERIAGATTDIQYLIHQGFTRHNATFWVGANALLRKTALEDICTEHEERGHRVLKYIQDRTVIEDTESSVDLVNRGWSLFNYPERLAYSATPSDFGSLLIQRRRWANGGLIILPKALRYLCRGPKAWRKAGEGFCRVHYLTSIAVANVALLVILFGAFERNMRSVWLLVCGLPYMILYARDLVLCGYRWSDFLRVYALNLLLVPIHLGGALKSLHQGATGQRTPFGRTPKVTGRTAAPAGYVLAEYGLLAASTIMVVLYVIHRDWLSATFAFTYAVFSGYAVFQFIGLRDSVADLRLSLRRPTAPVQQAISASDSQPVLPSNVVLYCTPRSGVAELAGIRKLANVQIRGQRRTTASRNDGFGPADRVRVEHAAGKRIVDGDADD